jgi:hypothetical protein
MDGAQAMKHAGIRRTGNLLAAPDGKLTLTLMIRCTVAAMFLTNTIRRRDLRHAPLSMVDLEGQKFLLGRVPDPLHAPHLARGPRRRSEPTGYHPIGLLEALLRHYTPVAATEHQSRATCVTVSVITPTPATIPPPTGVMMCVVSIAGTHQRTTMQVIATIPRDDHIMTTTTEATIGTLMGPGTSLLVVGLWPTIIVLFLHYNFL